jgi:hypothetical protein
MKTAQELLDTITDHQGHTRVAHAYEAAVSAAWKAPSRTRDHWDVEEMDTESLVKCGRNLVMVILDETQLWAVSLTTSLGVDVTEAVREMLRADGGSSGMPSPQNG